jgi:hypothetical protein
MTKAKKVFNLFFYNDSAETEHYGTYSTRRAALRVIKDMQAEFGSDIYATEAFSIETSTVEE